MPLGTTSQTACVKTGRLYFLGGNMMKKRVLPTLLALCMVLALLPVTSFAATSGTRGDNITWTLDDNGHLTISGTGVIYQPDHLDEEWIDQVKTIDIGEGITELGPVAFELGGCIIKVKLPETLTKIGADAFYLESNLEEINIPGKVTEIGEGAFFGCKKLTGVTLPDGLTTIGEMAFLGMDVPSVTVPRSVANIGEWGLGYRMTETWETEKIPGFTIYGYAGTEAERYAKANGFTFSALSDTPSTPASSGISVTVGGKAVEWTDAKPFIDANSRTMVPLRAVADAMKLTVNWDSNVREASFSNGSKTIYFPIDNTSARTSDGGAVQMDTAAVIVNDRTYAPIRYLAEYFGYEVGWDAATQTVSLK